MSDDIVIKEMTKEDMDQLFLEHDLLGISLGFKNGEEMENFKVDASLGMIKFGGSFAHALGNALAHADSNNTAKIIKAFRQMCEDHVVLYRKWLSKKTE